MGSTRKSLEEGDRGVAFPPTPTAESLNWHLAKPLSLLDSEKDLSASGMRVPHRIEPGDSQAPQPELARGDKTGAHD